MVNDTASSCQLHRLDKSSMAVQQQKMLKYRVCNRRFFGEACQDRSPSHVLQWKHRMGPQGP